MKLTQSENFRQLAFDIEKGRRDYLSGIVEAKMEGKAEGKAELIMKMLKSNTPIDFIVRITGMSEDEIEAIRRKS